MCAVTTWPVFSFTRKVVLGKVSTTSPSIWIASSFDIRNLWYPRRPRILPEKRTEKDNTRQLSRTGKQRDGGSGGGGGHELAECTPGHGFAAEGPQMRGR